MAVLTGTQAALTASTTLVPLNDRWVETDTAIVRNGKFFYRYKIGLGTTLYGNLPYASSLTADLTFATCIPLTPPVNPCPGNGCVATVTVNGENIATFDPCEEPQLDLLVEDEDGNPLTVSFDGNIIVVTLPPAVMPFIHYADRTAMLADAVTIPTDQQEAIDDATGNRYVGDNVLTVAALVAANRYTLGVTRVDPGGPLEGLDTDLAGTTMHIQLN
jgi:hypothetical protein